MIYIRNLLDLVTIFTDILRFTSVRVNCLVMVTHSKTKMVDFFKKAKFLPQPFRPERQRGKEQFSLSGSVGERQPKRKDLKSELLKRETST